MAQETKVSWRKKHPVLTWVGGLATLVVGGLILEWLTDLNPIQHVASWISFAWGWFWGDVTVPAWIFVPCSAAVVFLVLCGGRRAWHWSKARRAEPEPAWKRYKSDVFLDIVWELKLSSHGHEHRVLPLCPKCEGLLSVVMDGQYRCTCCPEKFIRQPKSSKPQLEYIAFEADRRLRNGDWKQAPERVAKFREEHGGAGGGA